MSAVMQEAPVPQPCHACGVKYAGIACPTCKEERPAWIAVKNMTAARHAPAPLPICRYEPKALCGCDLRGECLETV